MTIKEKELRDALKGLMQLTTSYAQSNKAFQAAEAALMIEPDHPLDEAYREAARDLHQEEGEVEIDDDAVISYGDDYGAYVQAWVWVSNEGLPIGCTDCDTLVTRDDPYYATPCGTYCTSCMRDKHAVGCEICRNEFDITVKRTRNKKD